MFTETLSLSFGFHLCNYTYKYQDELNCDRSNLMKKHYHFGKS
ncbi:hypothetical protein [Anabaena azotica]|nr:hypothetical protein [Anabaena azotica]